MSNKQIVKLIEERLELGKREYTEQLDVNDGRNWLQEALEEALDLCVYLTAEIQKRIERPYRYIATARLEDHDNGLYQLESSGPLAWHRIQEEMAILINDGAFGDDKNDWMSVYIDTCIELSPDGDTDGIFVDGYQEVDKLL